MKKKELEKSKQVTDKLLDVLQKEFPSREELDCLMLSLEVLVAAVLKGMLGLGNDEVNFFAKNVKRLMKQGEEIDDDEDRSDSKKDNVHEISVELANELISMLGKRLEEELEEKSLDLTKDERINLMGTTLAHEVAYFMTLIYQGHNDECKKSSVKRFFETVEFFIENGEIEVVD